MLTLTYQTVVFATLQIFLMAACGYVLVKKRIILEDGLNLLSWLVINFFLPLFTFYQLTQNFDFGTHPHWWVFPLISFGVTFGGFFVAQSTLIFSKGVQDKEQFAALVSFQNSGHIPLLLVATMFEAEIAQQLFIYIFLFLIGFDLTLWSFGVRLLTKHKIERFELRSLLNTPLLTIVVSLLLIFFNLQRFIPKLLLVPIKMFGDCALPLAMMVVGGNLGLIKIFEGNQRDLIKVVLTKVVLVPSLALGLVMMLKLEFFMGFLIILETAVPSAVNLSVIARHYNTKEQFINQGIFFSHLVSIVTMPVFLILYIHLVK